jgi:zinc/manganese transport system substrate-binding protein
VTESETQSHTNSGAIWRKGSRRRGVRRAIELLAIAVLAAACTGGSTSPSGTAPGKSIVVTYSVLGAVVKDLVGSAATVTVLMPNGSDPHEWAPSAKDIETMTKADLLVENGLNLEGGMGDAFTQAEKAGVKRFIASDHITVRHVGVGEGISTSDPDQAVGAPDPHLWMDPLTMKEVVAALATQLKTDLGIDVSARATDLEARLTTLNDQIATILSTVPEAQRSLVTGHESMGYFAQRYSYKLVGAIIPSLSSQAETSAATLAALEAKVKAAGVKAVFTELGTDASVAQAVGTDTGAKVVELTTHALPPDGSYFTFLTNIANLVAENLK